MIVLERRFKPLPAEPDSTPEPDAATIRKATAKIRAAAAEEGEEEDEPEVNRIYLWTKNLRFTVEKSFTRPR